MHGLHVAEAIELLQGLLLPQGFGSELPEGLEKVRAAIRRLPNVTIVTGSGHHSSGQHSRSQQLQSQTQTQSQPQSPLLAGVLQCCTDNGIANYVLVKDSRGFTGGVRIPLR